MNTPKASSVSLAAQRPGARLGAHRGRGGSCPRVATPAAVAATAKRWLVAVVAVVSLRAAAAEPDWAQARGQVEALGRLEAAPARHSADGFPNDEHIQALFFDALPWKGKPTRVFAWLGLPEHATGKVPAVVLVHGGGGTAFREWVKKWNEHGFAAISIAVEGQTDVPAAERDPKRNVFWMRHRWAGPARQDIYGDSAEPLTDQWIYHAVADTVLANSLLRSLPNVDAAHVGVVGISWGGVIASTVIGIDTRFAFAVPVYGCGDLAESANQYGEALGHNDVYRQVWDPMRWLNRARMPVLWLSWPEDPHFPLDCHAACYRVEGGPHMLALIPGMKHSHKAAWTPPDSYAFAEAVVRTGRCWLRQAAAADLDDRARVEFESDKPLDDAVLVSTTGTGFTGSRTWTQSPAKLDRHDGRYVATAELPKGTTAWFINVHSGPLTGGSDYQERKTKQGEPQVR